MPENGTVTLRIVVVKWMQDSEAATSQPRHQYFNEVVALIARTLDADRVARIRSLSLWGGLDIMYQLKKSDIMSIAKDMLLHGNVPEEPISSLARLSPNLDNYIPKKTHNGISPLSRADFLDEDFPHGPY